MAGDQRILSAVGAPLDAVALAPWDVAATMLAVLRPMIRVAEVGKPFWPPGGEMPHPAAQQHSLPPGFCGFAHGGMARVSLKKGKPREVELPA